MNKDNHIIFGADGWYDALSGERINPTTQPKSDSELNAIVGVGASKSWEDAYNEAVRVVYLQARQIEAMKRIIAKHLDELLDEQVTVKRMNERRVERTERHLKYQPEIDRLKTILKEIEDIKPEDLT